MTTPKVVHDLAVHIRPIQAVVLMALSVAILAPLALAQPIAQPQDYHRYADTRAWAGIPHFWNVVSNLPFAAIGAAGALWIRRRMRTLFGDPAERTAYLLFYAAEFLTCFASAYYHAVPTNETLVWDRLAFSLMLTSFAAIIVTEFLSARIGRHLALPLAVLGIASVLYWGWTEARGMGDLRPYIAVQFYPLLVMPLLLAWSPGRYGDRSLFAAAALLYALAKACELADRPTFDATSGIVSGHTLKHLVAAAASVLPLLALRARLRTGG